MRDRDVAFKEMAKSSKTTADILRIACLAAALVLAQIVQSSGARAGVACARIDELRTHADAPIAATVDRLKRVSDASTARAAETCAGIIKAATTAAKLELAIIECFKMKLTIVSVRAELEKKAAHLTTTKGGIPFFMSELPPRIGIEEEEISPNEKRVYIIVSIESPGVIRPYIGFIDLSLKPNGEVNWIELGITDQPI